jgi:hypothetical protein
VDALDDVIVGVEELEGWCEVHRGVEYVNDDSFVVHWDWKCWGGAGVGVGVGISLE